MPSTTLWVTDGATEARHTARTSLGECPAWMRNAPIALPHSSGVRSGLVVIRQWASRSPPAKRPERDLGVADVEGRGAWLEVTPRTEESANCDRSRRATAICRPSAGRTRKRAVGRDARRPCRRWARRARARAASRASRTRASSRVAEAGLRDVDAPDRRRPSARRAPPGVRPGQPVGEVRGDVGAAPSGTALATLSPTPTTTQAERLALPARLAEDPADLPLAEHEIVGPLEADGARPAPWPDSARDTASPARRLSRSRPDGARRPEQHAEPEPPARRDARSVPASRGRPICSSATTAVPAGAPVERHGVQHVHGRRRRGRSDGSRSGADVTGGGAAGARRTRSGTRRTPRSCCGRRSREQP